jgi:hypothetical protein
MNGCIHKPMDGGAVVARLLGRKPWLGQSAEVRPGRRAFGLRLADAPELGRG